MAISEYLKNLRANIGRDLLMLPSVAAIIRDERGRILLQEKSNGIWSLPAGAIEPGETPAKAVVREVWEETGLTVRPMCIAGVFGGANGFRYTYSNGDSVEYTVILFDCEKIDGELGANDDETVRLEYFSPDEMPSLPIKYPRELFFQSNEKVFFDWDEKWIEELKK